MLTDVAVNNVTVEVVSKDGSATGELVNTVFCIVDIKVYRRRC